VITDHVDQADPAAPFHAPPVPSAPAAPPVSVHEPILQDLAITYTLPPIPPLPPYPPYPVVVSIPAFHPFPQIRDMVHQDRVIDSVKNIRTHPDHPPPPPQA